MNDTFPSYPKIASVLALPGYRLHVQFRNGDVRGYDFTPHLVRDEFQLLKTKAFFNGVQVDPSGYGLVWNDDMDIAASELWLNGEALSTGFLVSAAANNPG